MCACARMPRRPRPPAFVDCFEFELHAFAVAFELNVKIESKMQIIYCLYSRDTLDEQKELNCPSPRVKNACKSCFEFFLSCWLAPDIFDVRWLSSLIAPLPRANELLGLLRTHAAVLAQDLSHAATNVGGHAKTVTEGNKTHKQMTHVQAHVEAM